MKREYETSKSAKTRQEENGIQLGRERMTPAEFSKVMDNVHNIDGRIGAQFQGLRFAPRVAVIECSERLVQILKRGLMFGWKEKPNDFDLFQNIVTFIDSSPGVLNCLWDTEQTRELLDIGHEETWDFLMDLSDVKFLTPNIASVLAFEPFLLLRYTPTFAPGVCSIRHLGALLDEARQAWIPVNRGGDRGVQQQRVALAVNFPPFIWQQLSRDVQEDLGQYGLNPFEHLPGVCYWMEQTNDDEPKGRSRNTLWIYPSPSTPLPRSTTLDPVDETLEYVNVSCSTISDEKHTVTMHVHHKNRRFTLFELADDFSLCQTKIGVLFYLSNDIMRDGNMVWSHPNIISPDQFESPASKHGPFHYSYRIVFLVPKQDDPRPDEEIIEPPGKRVKGSSESP
jgi:hypothetical protein